MTWAVYAIAHQRDSRLRVRGLRDEPLKLVSAGRLAAVVGELPRWPASTPATLAAYHDVIQRLWLELPSILPVRFGTHVDDRVELQFILRARGARLARTLRRVRRRAQMTIRMTGSRDRESGMGDRGSGTEDRGSGAAYLRSRASVAARARAVPELEPLRPAVRRWVRDERVQPGAGLTTVYHLIPRASAAAYRRALTTAAAAAGVRLAVTGPFAPFAFADDLLQ